MTRRLNDRMRAVEALRFPDEYPEPGDGWGTLAEARQCCFALGDVVPVWDFDKLKTALIVTTFRRHSENTGDWLAMYRARYRRKDGAWANCFNVISPGEIDRGFNAQHHGTPT